MDDPNYSWLEINLAGFANATNAQPPLVNITTPTNSAEFVSSHTRTGTPITITATAQPVPDATIQTIIFYASNAVIGNVPIGQKLCDASPGTCYSTDWGWADVPPGQYTLRAVATDNTGLTGVSEPVTINVLERSRTSPILQVLLFGTNNLPSGSTVFFGLIGTNTPAFASLVLSNPSAYKLVCSNIQFSEPGPFFVDTAPSVPFTIGPYQSVTIVIGAANNAADSSGPSARYLAIESNDDAQYWKLWGWGASVHVYELLLIAVFTNQCPPPTIHLTSPTNLAVFNSNEPILLAATAESGELGINWVRFYASGPYGLLDLGQASQQDMLYVKVVTNLPSGQYTFFAVAMDNNFAATVSDRVNVTVMLRPTDGPVFTLLSQSNAVVHNHATTDFGITTIGVPITNLFIVSNAGITTLTINKIFHSNTNNFSLGLSFDLYDEPLRLAPGASTNFLFTYLANKAGLAESTLVVYHNDVAEHPFHVTNMAAANPVNSSPPNVQIASPPSGLQLALPCNISVTAIATAQSGVALQKIEFFAATPTNTTRLSQVSASPNQTNLVATIHWQPSVPGKYILKAVATDLSGLVAKSDNCLIDILDPNAGSTNPPLPNLPPVARDDALWIVGCASNCPTYTINVLANDYDPNNDIITLTGFYYPEGSLGGRLGHVTQDGNLLLFTPNPYIAGTNWIAYTITDGKGGYDTAWVQVWVRTAPLPFVQLVEPYDRQVFYFDPQTDPTNRVITLKAIARVSDPQASIVRVNFYLSPQDTSSAVNHHTQSPQQPYIPISQATLLASLTTPNAGPDTYLYRWVTPPAGQHRITAYAIDSAGQESLAQAYIDGQWITSAGTLITVLGNTNNLPPIAAITNLLAIQTNGLFILPVVSNDVIDIQGIARDIDESDIVSYRLQLFNSQGAFVADLTPTNHTTNGWFFGSDYQGFLATNVNLSRFPNGIYQLHLDVFDGWEISSYVTQFILDSQLKLGRFTFSVQDLVIPVNGIPLTIMRTYDSYNTQTGDFGPGWTLALHNLDVQLSEWRENVLDDDKRFSLRMGGSYDVTLTLPDGRRTTFAFYLEGPCPCSQAGDYQGCYRPKWRTTPGVQAKLKPFDQPELVVLGPLVFWRTAGLNTSLNQFDFRGFVLETLDGTRYIIEREDLGTHSIALNALNGIYSGEWENDPTLENLSGLLCVHAWGRPYLSRIEQLSRDVIKITPDSVTHYDPTGTPTRTLRIDRDPQNGNRITAIYDPNSIARAGTTSLPIPTLKYFYDPTNGNLIEVHKIIDYDTRTYEVIRYIYTNRLSPHYLMDIIDPRGIRVAKTYYDNAGRIEKIEDADGKRTEFVYEPDKQIQKVVDRLGRTNIYAYDLRGNVTAITNALGGITLMAYDHNNNKTNEILFLNGLPYATNRFVYDAHNLLCVSYDPLGYSNVFNYNNWGQLTESLHWDATCDCLRGTTNFYDDKDNLIATSDALGNTTTNFYNDRSLLTGSRDPLGNITTNFYDNLGNLIGTAVLQAGTLAVISSNTFAYDHNGNQTQSVTWSRRGGSNWTGATNTCIYDAQNRLVHTIDPLGFTNTTIYNALGKPEATTDKLGRVTRYDYDAQCRLRRTVYPDLTTELSFYDAEGRRTNSLDRANRSTRYVYDALGRLTHTIYPDNTTNTTVYDDLGRVRFTVDARGVTNALGYDRAGRRIAVTNAWGTPMATRSGYGYDERGNQIYFTNALNIVTTNVYDALNRLVEVQYPARTKTLTGYDAAGRRVAETNQDLIVTRFGYDGLGRLTAVTNAWGTTDATWATYVYDEAGNLLQQIDALNRTNRFEYDALGRRAKVTLPGNQFELFACDAVGNLVRHTNSNGIVITNQYDVMNRLANRSSVGGYRVSFAYTPTGQRQGMTDPSGTTFYLYDERDRLTNKVVRCSAPQKSDQW